MSAPTRVETESIVLSAWGNQIVVQPVVYPRDADKATIAGRTYAAINKCIYCGREPDAKSKLSDEHIIPISFGGTLVLRKASCEPCATKTCAIEDQLTKGVLNAARPHIGIVGRQKIKKRDRAPMIYEEDHISKTVSVPLSQHFSLIIVPRLHPPSLFSLHPVNTVPIWGFAMCEVGNTEAAHFVASATGRKISRLNLTGWKPELIYPFIAKCAYSFAVATLGYGSFTPVLREMIVQGEMFRCGKFVGELTEKTAPTNSLHELEMYPSEFIGRTEFIRVRLRLFSNVFRHSYVATVGMKPICRTGLQDIVYLPT